MELTSTVYRRGQLCGVFRLENRKEITMEAKRLCPADVERLKAFRNMQAAADGGKISPAFQACRRKALEAWLGKRDEEALRIMREGFLELDSSHHRDLSLFCDLAALTGTLDREIADAEVRAKTSRKDRARLAYLLHRAGRSAEALEHAETIPLSPLYRDLLVRNGKWNDLALCITKGDQTKDSKRKGFWSRVFDGDVDEARFYLDSQKLLPSAEMWCLLGDVRGIVTRDWKKDREEFTTVPHSFALETANDRMLHQICEDDLAKALVSHTGIPCGSAQLYFDNISILGDQEKAVRIALDILGEDRAYLSPDNYKKEVAEWGHRIVALNALLRMGRTDLAVEQLRKLLESGEPSTERGEDAVTLSKLFEGDVRDGVRWAPMGLRLAGLETGREDLASKLVFLMRIAGEPDPRMRLHRFCELSRKHSDAIKQAEMEGFVREAWVTMGMPGDPDLSGSKEKMLERLMKNIDHADPADYRPLGLVRGRIELGEPSDPRHGDPRQKDFGPASGYVVARNLIKEQGPEAAVERFRQIAIRIILDGELEAAEVNSNVYERKDRWRGTNGWGISPSPEGLGLACLTHWDLPTEVAAPASEMLAWMQSSRPKPGGWASRALEKCGLYREALMSLRSALLYENSETRFDVLHPVARLDYLEARHAMEEGRRKDLQLWMARFQALAPYRPEYVRSVYDALVEDDEADEARKLDAMVRVFWKARLEELPGNVLFLEAQAEWDREMAKRKPN